MRRIGLIVALCVLAAVAITPAQERRRPASPEGTASAQINGQWIDVTYGRPLLRGRSDVFGTGADFGKKLNDGGPIWRGGANRSTTLRSDVALAFGGTTVPAGEHVILVDLKTPREWTFVLSKQPYQRTYDPKNTTELWGGFNHQPAQDIVRVPMRVETSPVRVEQLTWAFVDVTATGGTLRLSWDTFVASVPFTVAR
jgi:hypothetical protein